jgi:hypothetical protein
MVFVMEIPLPGSIMAMFYTTPGPYNVHELQVKSNGNGPVILRHRHQPWSSLMQGLSLSRHWAISTLLSSLRTLPNTKLRD